MGQPGSWKHTALVVIAVGVGVVFAVGMGIASFLHLSTTTLHPNTTDVPSVTATAPAAPWTSAVERARKSSRAALVDQNLPGLSVAVGVEGEIVWAEGFGWANVEKRIPVSPATRFRIGHASKALTSAAVGLMLEKGRLHLTDEIQSHVPAYPRKQWPVTVRQLMAHMSGVRHYEDEAEYEDTPHCETAAEGVRSFAQDPLRFEPGTEVRYSTYAWVLLSAAVEQAAGEPFFTFMRTKIFDPLEMTSTTVDSATDPIADLATFYYPRYSGDPATGPELAKAAEYSCFAGAGAFVSTPSDLVRFGNGLVAGNLLPPAAVRMLQTPQLLVSGKETEFGLGWTVETVAFAGESALLASSASRTLLGGSTSFLIFPDRRIVVAVTSNISKASTRTFALSVAEAFAERK